LIDRYLTLFERDPPHCASGDAFAPIPVVRGTIVEPLKSTQSRPYHPGDVAFLARRHLSDQRLGSKSL
jgi:hypothetical protein